MFNSFQVTREVHNYYDRAGLKSLLQNMGHGNTRTIRLAVEGDSVPYRAVEDSPVVVVERDGGGWSVEGSVTQLSAEDAVTAILGFFGEYKPL